MLLCGIPCGAGRGRQLSISTAHGRAMPTIAQKCSSARARRSTFTDMSDVYGGGFIIEGDQITGKFARCRIKAKKDDGATINLVAACASDIMLQNVQFSLREVDANNVIRMFPGMDGMEIRYARCPAP